MPMKETTGHQELLPHLFRLEYSKMTAVLCRHFGLKHIEIAEDIVSETFLKATETWGVNGIPDNPVAWLYAVAKNKTKDHLKRLLLFEMQIRKAVRQDEMQHGDAFEFTQQTIADSQLAMIFAVCNPVIPAEAQVCLALQVLCGFSIEEIADAFLSKKETVKKRLLRARDKLRKDRFQIKTLPEEALRSRMDSVLRTLYLLFNEGYYSHSNDLQIRKELCSEAMRLALVLTGHPATHTTQANALLALMCYQSSRLDARTDASGDTVLFEQQDQSLWSRELIDRGNQYLVHACTGQEVSKYHLEAGIAYWHTTPAGTGKWQHILQLYNELVILEYTPVAALNRAFAFAKVYGIRSGIEETEKLQLKGYCSYHSLLGYLYADIDRHKAITHYGQALQLSRSASEKKTLQKEMKRLENANDREI